MELRRMTETTWKIFCEGYENAYDLYYRDELIVKQQIGDVMFQWVTTEATPCFMIVCQGKQYHIQERCLSLSGVTNFRDLGGYVNKNGRQVRYNCFYRSAPLCGLEKREKAYLEQLQIAHILDLRSEMELQGKEDIVLTTAQYHHISGISFDLKC